MTVSGFIAAVVANVALVVLPAAADEAWLTVEAPADARLFPEIRSEAEFRRMADIGGRTFALDIGLFSPGDIGKPSGRAAGRIRQVLAWAGKRGVDVAFVVGPAAFDASQKLFNPAKSPERKWPAWREAVKMVKRIMNDSGVPDGRYYIEGWRDAKGKDLAEAEKGNGLIKTVDKRVRAWTGERHPLPDCTLSAGYRAFFDLVTDRRYLAILREMRGGEPEVARFISEAESDLGGDGRRRRMSSEELRAKVRTMVFELTAESAKVRAVVYGATPAGTAAAEQLGRMGIKAVLLDPDVPGNGLAPGGAAVTVVNGRIVSLRTQDGKVHAAEIFIDCTRDGALLAASPAGHVADGAARRLIGEYEITEADCRGWRFAPYPVSLAFPEKSSVRMDPFPVDFRSIVPKKSACVNLLVPVCLSASPAAFRIMGAERTRTALGLAAGTAAALAVRRTVPVQDVDYAELRRMLERSGQRLRWLGLGIGATEPVFGEVVPGSLRDDCWMWGHDTGVYDHPCNNNSLPVSAKVSMPSACAYLGIPNVCVIRWKTVEPDSAYVREFASMKRVSWVVCGRMQKFDVLHRQSLELLKKMPNLTGLDLDDYFTGKGREDVGDGRKVASSLIGHRALVALRREIDAMGSVKPGLRMVIYGDQGMGPEWKPAMELVDEILYWTWRSDNLSALRSSFAAYRRLAPGKRTLLGIYLWDFGGKKPVSLEKMHDQLNIAYELYRKGEIDGMIFHCTPLVNKNLAAVEYARRWLAAHGDEIRPPTGDRAAK